MLPNLDTENCSKTNWSSFTLAECSVKIGLAGAVGQRGRKCHTIVIGEEITRVRNIRVEWAGWLAAQFHPFFFNFWYLQKQLTHLLHENIIRGLPVSHYLPIYFSLTFCVLIQFHWKWTVNKSGPCMTLLIISHAQSCLCHIWCFCENNSLTALNSRGKKKYFHDSWSS